MKTKKLKLPKKVKVPKPPPVTRMKNSDNLTAALNREIAKGSNGDQRLVSALQTAAQWWQTWKSNPDPGGLWTKRTETYEGLTAYQLSRNGVPFANPTQAARQAEWADAWLVLGGYIP